VRTTTVGSDERSHRGYTGHEQLAALDLIHMNGRVQDPLLGRFLSPDPFVQAPYHSQSLNRYSYVWNNPLSLVDPSGFQTTTCHEEMSGIDCDTLMAMDPDYHAYPRVVFGTNLEAIDRLIRSNIENPPLVGTTAIPITGVMVQTGGQGVLTWPGTWPAAGEVAKQAGTRIGVRGIPIVGGIIGLAIPGQLGNGECIGNPDCEEADFWMMSGAAGEPPLTTNSADLGGGGAAPTPDPDDEPSWTKARGDYWKARAQNAKSGEFSPQNISRMKKGNAPLHEEYGVPKELHHRISQRQGGSHRPSNLEEVWPWEHARIDPYRHYNGPKPPGF
jgi:RHS repeat-associated protein